MNIRTEQAAEKFFNALVPSVGWDYTDHKAKPLVLAAFHLYAKAWDGQRWNIGQWQWPLTTLRSGAAFDSDEPWTVLLRRAVEIARPVRRARKAG